MGEGAAQDRVRPAVPVADVQGAEAGVRQVREGAGGRGAAREEVQDEGEAGGVQAAHGGDRRPREELVLRVPLQAREGRAIQGE